MAVGPACSQDLYCGVQPLASFEPCPIGRPILSAMIRRGIRSILNPVGVSECVSRFLVLSFRHGLRVSELVALRWDMVDLKQGLMHVSRLKNGVTSTHPIRGPEIRALRRLQRDYPDTPYLFVTERKGPLTTSAVRKIIARAGQSAGIGFPVHPHMLRHSTGYKLANAGHDTRAIQHYLGHKNIQHTVRYTELSVSRFKDFWTD